MQSNEQTPGGIRGDAPPPEGHAYAPPQRQHIEDESDSRSGRASQTMERTQERMSEAGDRAKEQAEMGRERSAEGMESAASRVRESMGDRDDMAGKAATKTADTMERTAGYLKSHDNTQVLNDMESYVRDHPMQAMAGALVAGFLISRILR